MTILELREKRAKAWEATKAFLDSHRNEKVCCLLRTMPPTPAWSRRSPILARRSPVWSARSAGGGTEPPGKQSPHRQAHERQETAKRPRHR